MRRNFRSPTKPRRNPRLMKEGNHHSPSQSRQRSRAGEVIPANITPVPSLQSAAPNRNPDSQQYVAYGFRPMRSITTALIPLSTAFSVGFNQQSSLGDRFSWTPPNIQTSLGGSSATSVAGRPPVSISLKFPPSYHSFRCPPRLCNPPLHFKILP